MIQIQPFSETSNVGLANKIAKFLQANPMIEIVSISYAVGIDPRAAYSDYKHSALLIYKN
jgi:hypothetical protein